MLRNQDEDQLKQILSETFTNSNYVDEEIQDLLITHREEPPLKHAESVDSHPSQRSSESSPNIYLREESSIGSNPDRQSLTQQSLGDKIVEKFMPQSEQSQHIFDDFYRAINRNLRAETIEQVRQKYPLFLLSQPHYQIKNQIKEITLNYSGGLLRKNVLVIDAGYCEQQKVFKVAVGTDEGHVVIFEPNSSKPQQIIDCFGKISYITSVRWSKNLQYLAITNDEKELKVYQFKQAINIQGQISYRILKSPIEFCSLSEKQLKNLVIQLEFVTEIPFQMILVTEAERILRLQMRKQFLSLKPHLTEFQYKFNDFLDIKILTTADQNKNRGSFMAASGYELVTLCLIEPRFQIAMVYDKQKHGGHIMKTGYPQVSFRENPTSMMVVWDKYLEIIDIHITSFSPPAYSFAITHRFLLPDSTILSGFLSNSLLYQVTRMGVNIYSTTTFEAELPKKYEEKIVHFHGINYSNFCYGERIEDAISHNQVQLSDLRYLRGLFEPKNRTLFISTNKGVQMIYVSTLQQYINSLIENSNWKTALELLKDCYLGVVYQLDEIHPELILSKIKELSIRYINFLETIILNDIASNQSNILLLWNQELIFIFSIILKTDLQRFLLDNILPKVYKLNPNYLLNIVPFILTKQLNQITPQSLEIFLQTLLLENVSKLIFNLQPNNNEPQLPHQINNLLIKHKLYLELIELNQKFKDHYTPIAVLVGLYVRLQLDNDKNIMELTEEKRGIAKLIAYSVFDTLSGINFNKYSKNQNKEILTTVLPLLTEQIISILVRQQPTALFQNIFQELYMGTCLQTLNQLDLSNHEHDIMLNIVHSIDYPEVCRFGCQKKYWIAVLKLYARRIINMNIYQGLHYLCVEDYVEEEYMAKFVYKCYQQIQQELSTLSEDILTAFFQALLRTNHICLVKMIGKLLRRYIDALQAMFRCQPQRSQKIYAYLEECLPCLSVLQLQLLKPLLKQNIQLLADIDANKASDIICRYYLADLNLFIDDLASYKHQQLKLIHAVLQLYSYKESLIGLKVKYLELLAITSNQDKILEELMKENYPLDQSLDICRRYQVLEAYAYLLVKSGATGHIQEAITVYFKLVWQKIVKIVLNALDPQSELEHTIIYYVQQCIQICIELTTEDHQIEWFHIMQELQHLKKNIFKNLIIDMHTCELLKQIINKKAYPELIRRMITEVQYSNIIYYLKLKLSSFDLEAIQIVIDQMKKSYIYQKKMQIVVQEIFVSTENSLRKQLFKEQLQGFATNDICHFCQQKGGLLVHYHCGHEVHPSCGQDVRECMICLEDMDAIFEKKIDALLKTKVEIYSRGITGNLEEVEQQIQKENSLKKMESYDEMVANARVIIEL